MRQRNRVSATISFLAFIIVILSTGKICVALGLTNLANTTLLKMKPEYASDTLEGLFPFVLKQQIADPKLRWSQKNLLAADLLHTENCAVKSSLLRVELMLGDVTGAGDVLVDIQSPCLKNSITYLNSLIARSLSLDHTFVVALVDNLNIPMGRFEAITDEMVAFAHISQADSLLHVGRTSSALKHLEAAIEKRPEDLYALYFLSRSELLISHTEYLRAKEKLEHFDLDSFFFLDARLTKFTADAIEDLLSEGVWSKQATQYAIANTVWIKPTSLSTEHLLKSLVQRSPTQAEWKFLLAELYQRNDRWLDAQVVYSELVDGESDQDDVQLRLAEICEQLATISSSCSWQDIIGLYRSYQQINPKDLIVDKRFCEVVTRYPDISIIEPTTKMECFETSGYRLLAEQLALDPALVSEGPNLLPNSSFENVKNGHPVNWHFITMANSNPFDRALYNIGLDTIDSLDGQYSVRIGGVWAENSAEFAPPNSGVWFWDEASNKNGKISLLPDSLYLLSFFYRTDENSKGTASVWLNAADSLGGSFQGEHQLPNTQGAWHQAVLAGSIGEESGLAVSPLLRLSGIGQVWFDNVELRQITLPDSYALQVSSEPLLLILGN